MKVNGMYPKKSKNYWANQLNITDYILNVRYTDIINNETKGIKLCEDCYSNWLDNAKSQWAIEKPIRTSYGICRNCRKYTKEYKSWLNKKNNKKRK